MLCYILYYLHYLLYALLLCVCKNCSNIIYVQTFAFDFLKTNFPFDDDPITVNTKQVLTPLFFPFYVCLLYLFIFFCFGLIASAFYTWFCDVMLLYYFLETEVCFHYESLCGVNSN